MKARYVFLIIFLSLVVNGISLYNLPIGYLSIFIMLLVFIPNLFIKIIEFGKYRKAKGAQDVLVKAALDFEKNTHSKIPYIIMIGFMYIGGGALILFQIYEYDYIHALVTDNVNSPIFYAAAPYLIGAGYILFLASLVMMTIHFRKMFREEGMFQKNEESKYVENGREENMQGRPHPSQSVVESSNMHAGTTELTEEDKLWDLLLSSSRKATRLGIIIPIVFALTVVISLFSAIFLPETAEGAEQVMKIGLSIGFSVILVFYLITWFACLAFLRETKERDIVDEKLRRLIGMNRVSSILFMIPITFFVGLFGFHKVKIFAEGKVQRGTLDQIIYQYFIDT